LFRDLLSRKTGLLARCGHEFAERLARRVYWFDSESKFLRQVAGIVRIVENEILHRVINNPIVVAQTNDIVCDFEIARRVSGESTKEGPNNGHPLPPANHPSSTGR
jgi:hypothetical protein